MAINASHRGDQAIITAPLFGLLKQVFVEQANRMQKEMGE